MGYDKLKSLGKRETGGQAAAPTWRDFMSKAGEYQAKNDFPVPEGISFVPIAGTSGDLESPKPGSALQEAFTQENLSAGKDRSQDGQDTEASDPAQGDSEQGAAPIDNESGGNGDGKPNNEQP